MQAPTQDEIDKVAEYISNRKLKDTLKDLHIKTVYRTLTYKGEIIDKRFNKADLFAIINECYTFFAANSVGPFPFTNHEVDEFPVGGIYASPDPKRNKTSTGMAKGAGKEGSNKGT